MDMEKVIAEIEEQIAWIRDNDFHKFPGWGHAVLAMKDAITLLKKQEDEKKRVMKVIWDTLHEGLSIDTIPDQDWVYERIRHRIEDT